MSFAEYGGNRGGGYGGGAGGYGGGGSGYGGGASYGGSRDGDSEYIRLSNQVTSNIESITSNVSQLQKMVGFLGTQRDVQEMRDRMHSVQENTRRLVKETNNHIKQMGHFDGGTDAETRKRRMQQEKLSKAFKTALQKFQACSQVAISKERETVQRERAESHSQSYGGFQDYGGYEEKQHLIEEDQSRQRHQLDNQIDHTSSLINEREEGIKEIEATMIEVNEIYRDLNSLVVEQGTMIDNIEANMSSAHSHVENGTGQLGKASYYQKKARNKMCCLLVIVAIVGAILTIVLVTQLKK